MPYKDPEKQREYQQQWYQDHKEDHRVRFNTQRIAKKAYISNIKAKSPCVDCGNHFPPCAMDFDHIGDDKTAGIAQLASSSATLIEIDLEIAKCELVCACCHRIRTQKRIQESARSGIV